MGSVEKWSGFSTCFTCCAVPSWFSDRSKRNVDIGARACAWPGVLLSGFCCNPSLDHCQGVAVPSSEESAVSNTLHGRNRICNVCLRNVTWWKPMKDVAAHSNPKFLAKTFAMRYRMHSNTLKHVRFLFVSRRVWLMHVQFLPLLLIKEEHLAP